MNNFDVAQEKTKSSSVQCNIRLNIPLSAAACKGFDPFIEIAVRLKKIVHSLPLGIGMCLITKAVLIEEDYLKEIELTFLPNTAQVDTTDDERRLGQCFKMLFDSWIKQAFFRALDVFLSTDWLKKYTDYCQSATHLTQEDAVLEKLFDEELNKLGLTKPPSDRPSCELIEELKKIQKKS